MITYQDYLKVGNTEQAKQDFILSAINHYKGSRFYKNAYAGKAYYELRNITILRFQKWLYDAIGQRVEDKISANHKCGEGLFKHFVRQQNSCLLSNGVTFNDKNTKDKLGGVMFDVDLSDAGIKALWGGVVYGFFNIDHIVYFDALEFVPLYDEITGALMAGIRYYQIDSSKPLSVTFYELDGYTGYLYGVGGDGTNIAEITEPKRAYKLVKGVSGVGEEILAGENYPTFPIVPLWGNTEHQSELTDMLRNEIDSYDLIISGLANIIDDTSDVFWTLTNANANDEFDAIQFKNMVKRLQVAYDGAAPSTINIPYDARIAALNTLKEDMYSAYGAMDTKNVYAGNVSATAVRAAYEVLKEKVETYETCVMRFIMEILKLAGIDDSPKFNYSMIANAAEEIQTIMLTGECTSRQYKTRKILTLLGDIDQVEEVEKEIVAEELARFNMPDGE